MVGRVRKTLRPVPCRFPDPAAHAQTLCLFLSGSHPAKRGGVIRYGSVVAKVRRSLRPFSAKGFERNFEPFKPYRHGNSTALVMPIRTPATISGAMPRACTAIGG